jgi:hypothetical protein
VVVLPAHALPQMIQISASSAGRLAGTEVIGPVSRSRAIDASTLPTYGQGHPIVRPGADYWATYEWSDEITAASGRSFTLANWHRPLPAMIDAFTAAGFRIAAISEPPPGLDTPRELLPDFPQDKPPGAGFLCFLFFVLEAD